MLHDTVDVRKIMLLKKLSSLARNITQLSDNHNLIEFVLHELCHEDCFNLQKAAYLVDNQDFDCLHGIVGVDKTQPFLHNNIWQVPDDFSSYMNNLIFNKKVKELQCKSNKCLSEKEPVLIQQLGNQLGIECPKYHIIPLKYDNKGILLYETASDKDIEENDFISGLSFLSLCPLF
ncbi:hypothetical protein EKK58_04575 [Candidatus Dependentiae bacterium]|nr:MAG: hypothetical protein EKK58_04575 [Candidatus Dependentiae bacterium]